jgi:putative transposase
MWFLTVALAHRRGNDLLVRHIDQFRVAYRTVQRRHPFRTEAIVVLPDHLHCIWQLPSGDSDLGTRWGLIKSTFSRRIPGGERISDSRRSRGERGLWQRRFWDHQIRDDLDLARHVDYIHYNPVKHGHVLTPCLWPHSSFHRFVELGLYPADWATAPGEEVGNE